MAKETIVGVLIFAAFASVIPLIFEHWLKITKGTIKLIGILAAVLVGSLILVLFGELARWLFGSLGVILLLVWLFIALFIPKR